MSNWRDLGDVDVAAYRSEFARLYSPMAAEADAIHAAAGPHSALCLAMLWVEQKYATLSSIPVAFHNPLSLAKPAGTPADGDGRWERYGSWAEGVRAWRERITSPTYKGGVYARTVTLADLVAVYAPPSENDSGRYLRQLEERMALFPRTETPPMAGIPLKQVMMAGCATPVWIPAELAFRQEIIPAWQTNQRPGIPFWGGAASDYSQHDTGNPNFGADAPMHSRYMHNGAEGQRLGYHLTVDDKVLVQMVPLDEVTWHAGDGNGPGNMDSIACELCIHSNSDHIASRRYAAIVAAGVMHALGIDKEPVQHNKWSGKDCPGEMRRTGTWNGYLAVFRAARAQMQGEPDAKPEPEYAPAVVLDLGVWDGKDRVLPDGTVMRACKRTITARGTTKRYQRAATTAPSIGPDLHEGDEAAIEYVFQARQGGARWAYTSWGSRLRLAHFTPYITIEPKG